MKPKISVLVSARKNSKYLAKFLFGFLERTSSADTEILVMLNEHDTWNDELVSFFHSLYRIEFFRENLELGRAGLHEYFNELYKHAKGEWIVYFCEDHFITMPDWDDYLRRVISGEMTVKVDDQHEDLKHNNGPLDPDKIWCIIPKFDNCGAMNQVLSRGYCEALGGKLGNHGWIDSYINDLNLEAFGDLSIRRHDPTKDRVILIDDEMFHDFTHDQPNPMSDAHMQSVSGAKAKSLPKYKDPVVKRRIEVDAEKLRKAMERGL